MRRPHAGLRIAALYAILLAAALCAACGRDARPAPPSPAPFEKGMVFGLFARDEPDYPGRALDELRALGVTSICIMMPWVTPDVRSLEMAPRGDMTPSDASLSRAIRAAHARGMTVLLMPFLYVDRMEKGEWRGTLAPPDWGAWFSAYGRFLLHYAALAKAEQVAWLSIGSELCSTEARDAEWLTLIDEVRQAYPGRITYSFNWDHLSGAAFARRLDVLGMNAYFEVGRDPGAGEAEMVNEWKKIRADIETWRRAAGLDIIVTEIGYPSRTGAAADPWNYDAPGEADPEAQRRAYRAFRESWKGDPHLRGVYFYIWWGDGGPADTGYTPRGKPAEEVLREWYRSAP